jgi:hypothetical protein
MLIELLLAFVVAGGTPGPAQETPAVAFKTHTYEAKIRLKGRVSTTQVQANDAGHAKKLVQAQFGLSDLLGHCRVAGDDLHVVLTHAEPVSQDGNDGLVGASLLGRRPHLDLQGVAQPADDLVTRRTR